MKIDPSGQQLHEGIDLNNLALARFSADERQRMGVHTCPGVMEHRRDMLEKPLRAKFDGGDIDRDLALAKTRILPRLRLPAGFTEHPPTGRSAGSIRILPRG